MKCHYCNQEMIDIKDYCINCGKRLIKENKKINIKGLIIGLIILIIAGFLTCYVIINYNTEKELEPYLENVNK